jgi:dienelactone hydrolase
VLVVNQIRCCGGPEHILCRPSLVDSFASRGIKESCDQLGLMPSRQADALGALLYLSKPDFVDPKGIAVVGSSQGGVVALQLASTHAVELFAFPDNLKFKAAVAYYPPCGVATITRP